MLLTPRSEELDFLNVLAANRREVRIELETNEPLRKPRPRQSYIQPASEQARQALDTQLLGRAPFRGRVAVSLSVTLPRTFRQLGLKRVVKAHLDLLQGSVFADDRAVDHLQVHLRVADVPRAKADLICLPLTVFCNDFDRAFRLANELFVESPERGWGSPFDRHEHSMLGYDMGLLDVICDLDAQEDEQLEDDPDGCIDLDVPSGMAEFGNWEVRAATREHLEVSIPHARGRWLCDHGFDSHDRAGPEPTWQQEAQYLDTVDVLTLDDDGPGLIRLSPPPLRSTSCDEQKWGVRVQQEIRARLAEYSMTAVKFAGPVALDIAFCRGCGDHADLDNLASKVVAAFSEVLDRSALDLTSYRAYRLPASERGVRVRVLPEGRLLSLSEAMHRGRGVVRDDRLERRRAAKVP